MINQPIGRCVSDFIVNVLSRGGGFKSEDNNADVCQLGGTGSYLPQASARSKKSNRECRTKALSERVSAGAASMDNGKLPDIGEEEE
jgi:hypothetical protein